MMICPPPPVTGSSVAVIVQLCCRDLPLLCVMSSKNSNRDCSVVNSGDMEVRSRAEESVYDKEKERDRDE